MQESGKNKTPGHATVNPRRSDPPWTTVLIEDQALLCSVLARAIGFDGRFNLVAEVHDGVQGRLACLEHHPRLVITDLHIPRLDGFELARFLIKCLPRTRIIILTHEKDPFTINRLQETGVHGYVEKNQPLEILEEAMVEVASGRNYYTATLCRVVRGLEANPEAFSKFLNPREQEVLCLVAQGLQSRQVADRLKLSQRSIETYRYRIMKKLNLRGTAALIEYAFRSGFTHSETAGQARSLSRFEHLDQSR